MIKDLKRKANSLSRDTRQANALEFNFLIVGGFYSESWRGDPCPSELLH